MDHEGAAFPTQPSGLVLETASRASLRAAPSHSLAPAPPRAKPVAQLEWPGPNLTRPVSPQFAPRRPSRVLRRQADTEIMQRRRHTSPQPNKEDVFDRLARPRARVADASACETKLRGNASTAYTGHTIPKEFALSVSNHPGHLAALSRASEPQLAQTRKPFTDIKNFDPKARTVPVPFGLKSVELHDLACARRKLEQRRAERELDERRKYRAVPLKKELLQGPTFVPVLLVPEEVVTVPDENFCRNSDVRAQNRAQFDMDAAARIQNEASLIALANAAREKADEERRRAMWISHAFRARNVPASHYVMDQPPVPLPPYPPTSPHSPEVMRRPVQRRKGSENNT